VTGHQELRRDGDVVDPRIGIELRRQVGRDSVLGHEPEGLVDRASGVEDGTIDPVGRDDGEAEDLVLGEVGDRDPVGRARLGSHRFCSPARTATNHGESRVRFSAPEACRGGPWRVHRAHRLCKTRPAPTIQRMTRHNPAPSCAK